MGSREHRGAIFEMMGRALRTGQGIRKLTGLEDEPARYPLFCCGRLRLPVNLTQ